MDKKYTMFISLTEFFFFDNSFPFHTLLNTFLTYYFQLKMFFSLSPCKISTHSHTHAHTENKDKLAPERRCNQCLTCIYLIKSLSAINAEHIHWHIRYHIDDKRFGWSLVVAWWLATCTWKPKVPGSSPATSYVQRWALCSNRPANV